MSAGYEDLGPCCSCRTEEGVRNILMLPQKSPIRGRGWACFQCGADANGAIAVLCDACLERTRKEGEAAVLQEACRGHPRLDGRVPYGELTGEHRHNMALHPEAEEDDDC